MRKNKTWGVSVPEVNYIPVKVKGSLNEEGRDYQKAISVLYVVA